MGLALYLSRVRSSDLLGAMRAAVNRVGARKPKYMPPRTVIAIPYFGLESSSSVQSDRASPKLLSWQIVVTDPYLPFAWQRAKQAVRSGLPDAATSDASNDKELREIAHCRVT